MYKVEYVSGEEIPEGYRSYDNDYHTMLKITYNNGVSEYYSDEYEPEDVSFGRDLSWIKTELEAAYEEGFFNGRQ